MNSLYMFMLGSFLGIIFGFFISELFKPDTVPDEECDEDLYW